MNDMENITLQNGEIAFLQSGTVIMNVDTAIELSDKLEARQKNTEEQSAEEAMENVMLLLALLFGPEILDEPKVSKLQKPVAPTMPARTPEDDTHRFRWSQSAQQDRKGSTWFTGSASSRSSI